MKREDGFLSNLERVCERFVCVCVVFGREQEERERNRHEVIHAWRYETCCMENQEIKMRWHGNSQLLLLGFSWAEIWEGRKDFWALLPLSPHRS